jgi:hypothetical protein
VTGRLGHHSSPLFLPPFIMCRVISRKSISDQIKIS